MKPNPPPNKPDSAAPEADKLPGLTPDLFQTRPQVEVDQVIARWRRDHP